MPYRLATPHHGSRLNKIVSYVKVGGVYRCPFEIATLQIAKYYKKYSRLPYPLKSFTIRALAPRAKGAI